jgi:hypothetical protein
MLGKRLSGTQWGSLVILTIGVSLAQLSAKHKVEEHHNSRAGFIAVLSAACTSGFSGTDIMMTFIIIIIIIIIIRIFILIIIIGVYFEE